MNGRWSITTDSKNRVVITVTDDAGVTVTAKLAADDAVSFASAMHWQAAFALRREPR